MHGSRTTLSGLPRVALLGLAAAALAFGVAADAHAFALVEHGPIAFGAAPSSLTAGTDGSMWFTAAGERGVGGAPGIGRIARDGTVTQFGEGLPSDARPRGLVRAGDGTMWFVDDPGQSIGRVTPAGAIEELRVTHADVAGLAPAPDGDVWLVLAKGAMVGRVGADRVIRRTPTHAPRAVKRVTAVAPASGGRVIFAAGPWLATVAASGTVTWRSVPEAVRASALASGPDGRLWMATTDGRVLRLDARGRRASRVTSTLVRGVTAMAAGAGRMWLAQPDRDRIAEVTPRGRVTEHGPGAQRLRPVAIARDAHGRLWLAGQDRVVRVVREHACAVPDVVTLAPAAAREALVRAGCRADVRAGVSTGAGPVRVVVQSVAPGRVLPRDGTVVLTTGPQDCHFGTGWTVTARSETASIAYRRTRNGGGDSVTWNGCLAATGVPRRLARAQNDNEEDSSYVSVGLTLAGSRVLVATSSSYKELVEDLGLLDLTGTGKVERVVLIPEGSMLRAHALNAAGAVAWVQAAFSPAAGWRGSIFVKTPAGSPRLLREGAGEVTGLRVDADTVSWTEADGERTMTIAP